jgi:hypothetical protein
VRIADGTVEVDAAGKKPGRGAYLCRRWQCWEAGISGGRLEHSLRITLTRDNREGLMIVGQALVKENIGG